MLNHVRDWETQCPPLLLYGLFHSISTLYDSGAVSFITAFHGSEPPNSFKHFTHSLGHDFWWLYRPLKVQNHERIQKSIVISTVYISNAGSLIVSYRMKGPPTASKEHVYGLRTKPST